MALFFTVTLGISIVGMLLLLGFKRYELVSGNVLFASRRPAIGSFFKHTLWWIEKVLPALVRAYSRRAWHFCKTMLQQSIAKSILWVEHSLERVLHTVREQTTVERTPGEASAFLREVAEHKRKLSRKPRKPRAATPEYPDLSVHTDEVQKSEFEVE